MNCPFCGEKLINCVCGFEAQYTKELRRKHYEDKHEKPKVYKSDDSSNDNERQRDG